MKAASGTLLVVAAVCAVAMTGCQKQLDLTFVNHTQSVVQVRVSTPETGSTLAGSLGPSGSKLRYTVRIEPEDLPTVCTCTVGLARKTFTVTQDTKGKLWLHYTKTGLSDPMDKDTPPADVEGRVKLKVSGGTVVE